jgi:hypothetical protein
MTPRNIIDQARHITLDTDLALPRQSDAELLSYVQEGLREACVMRPDLFSTVGDMTCIAGQCEQSITFLDAVQMLDVLCIHGGRALTPFDRAAMDQFRPGWRTDPAGEAQNWAPLNGDPLQFFIYPKAPTGQVLDVRYVRNPGVYAMDDMIVDLPIAYQPALADYLVYRAESKDDEHVLSQRAAAHYAAFKSKFGAANGATV